MTSTSTRCLVNYTKLNRSDFVSHIQISFTTWTHQKVKTSNWRPWPEIPHHGPLFDDVPMKVVVFPLRKVFNCQRVSYYTHRIHGAARKMVTWLTWIPSIYPSHVSIFLPAPAGSIMGYEVQFPSDPSVPRTLLCHRFPNFKAGESHRESNPHFLRTTGDTHLWCTQACAQVTVGV